MWEGSLHVWHPPIRVPSSTADFPCPRSSRCRYYRDALCTLGMAFASGLEHQPTTPSRAAAGGGARGLTYPGEGHAVAAGAQEETVARTLFVQAAKVITANAASVGDTLLGVPLLCCTGKRPHGATARGGGRGGMHAGA
jgi:hypothetical protein